MENKLIDRLISLIFLQPSLLVFGVSSTMTCQFSKNLISQSGCICQTQIIGSISAPVPVALRYSYYAMNNQLQTEDKETFCV